MCSSQCPALFLQGYMFLPNIFATGDEDTASLGETYFCIMVEVLNFTGLFCQELK
ncbi:hypothetical protein ACRRTK_024767 [Alexandromys fortis]